MNYNEKVAKNLEWRKMSSNSNSFSKISDKSAILDSCKECTWCSTKLLLTDNKHEYEMLDEVLKKQHVIFEFDFASKSRKAALNKFNKLGFAKTKEELKLPIRCKYKYEWLSAGNSDYRIKGSYEFEIGKNLQGYSACLNNICPCCGNNIYEKIETLTEKEYNKLIKNYKAKVTKENVEVDLSSFDVEGYLGVLVELYKDSYILENQIKSMLTQKYLCQKNNCVIGISYINANRDRKSEGYILAEKKLEKFQNEKTNEISLTPSEEKAAWEKFLEADEKWSILFEEITPPVVPFKPEEPVAPKKPKRVKLAQFKFDESRLVKPAEPTYLQSNFFNKKKIEKQNEELKRNYEKAIEDYNCACLDYEKAKEKYSEDCATAEKEYQITVDQYLRDMVAFEDACKKYEIDLKAYEFKKSEYDKELLDYKVKMQQAEIISKEAAEKKNEIYERTLEEKKRKISDEKAELKKLVKEYLADQKSELDREVLDIPDVIANDTMVAFLDDEVSKLLTDLFDVYGAIDELKSMNVVYPKYTNFSVLCTLYEYFQSGRANELTGPHGAYNLYESERRADDIINKLDVINFKLDDILDKLDEVKNNQVVLYKTMNEVKFGIDNVNSGITKLALEIGKIGVDLKKVKDSSLNIGSSSSVGIKSTGHTALPLHISRPVTSLPSYSTYSSYMSTQRLNFDSTVKQASVIKRGIVGAVLAGPAGAVVGALSAVDHNRRLESSKLRQELVLRHELDEK